MDGQLIHFQRFWPCSPSPFLKYANLLFDSEITIIIICLCARAQAPRCAQMKSVSSGLNLISNNSLEMVIHWKWCHRTKIVSHPEDDFH